MRTNQINDNDERVSCMCLNEQTGAMIVLKNIKFKLISYKTHLKIVL